MERACVLRCAAGPRALSLKARLKPLAKKPPKGAMMDAKLAMAKPCHCMGEMVTYSQPKPDCARAAAGVE